MMVQWKAQKGKRVGKTGVEIASAFVNVLPNIARNSPAALRCFKRYLREDCAQPGSYFGRSRLRDMRQNVAGSSRYEKNSAFTHFSGTAQPGAFLQIEFPENMR